MAITNVYVDGFNLYYRVLKGTPHKWLNLGDFCQAVLPDDATVRAIKYYTAPVSGRVDPGSPARQNAYLRAIKTLPNVEVFFGKFMVTQKWSGLVQPPNFRPQAPGPLNFSPHVAYVWKTEEKGSDVNLGVHLVRDACKGAFEAAAVLTNDTDLTDAIRIVTEEMGLPVILLTPVARPATSLVRVSTSVRHVAPYVGPCQFPNEIPVPGKSPIRKPAGW